MAPVIHRTFRWAACVLLLCVSMSATAVDRLVVYSVNYPLAYFAERIGGKHVEVHFPAPPGVDPAFWTPDVETLGDYQRADLILLNGADYAKWVGRVSLPRRRLVNTSQPFSDDFIQISGAVKHQHGPAGDHSHAGTAFTTWLDFSQAAQQAGQVAAAFTRLRPAQAADFERNLQGLQDELQGLDARMQLLAQRHPGVTLLASHPVYQYLARRYRMTVRPLTWEPDVYPDSSSWQALQTLLQSQADNWMLWENEPLQQTRDRLAALGVQVVVFTPAMNRSSQGDFMELMLANVERLEAALDSGPGP